MPLRLLTLASLLALSACSIPAPLPPTPLPGNSADTPQIERLWSRYLQSSLGYLSLKGELASDSERLYLCSNHSLSALNKDDGELAWQRLSDSSYSGCLRRSDDGLYVVDASGLLVKLQSSSGDELWRQRLSAGVYHPVAPRADNLLVISEDAQLYLLNSQTGARILTLPGNKLALNVQGSSAPAYGVEQVFYSQSGLSVQAMRLSNGQINWEQRLSASPDDDTSEVEQIRADLLYADAVVYALPYSGQLAALRAVDGVRLWERELYGSANMLLDSGSLYLFHADATLVKLEAQSGLELWRASQQLGNRLPTAPVKHQQMLMAADNYGRLHFFAEADGAYLGHRKLSPYPIKLLAADAEAIYALDAKGWLQKTSVIPAR